jgi:5-methylthioadenosine/S-adenosylhomocysteine deaminase
MSDKPQDSSVDLIIKARWIVPVVPANKIFEDCALVIDQGQILALLPHQEADRRFIADKTINLPHHLLTPGLINAHCHAAMSLFRGYADDQPLHQWLTQSIWPAEKRWVSDKFVRDGSELAIAEMIQSGISCFSDMYFFPEETAQACLDAKLRCQLSFPVMDFATAWGSGADEYMVKGLALHDNFRDSELINIAFGPHAPYTVSESVLRRIAILAQEMDMPVQIHLHETAQEIADSLKIYNKRPSQRLMDLGLLSPLTQCVHMTQIDETDIALLQHSGASIIHCPESNLKLASGFCPVQKLLDAGINVAIGTDGTASNNDLSLLGEMKTAALLAKAVTQDASAVNAHTCLRMATLNAAMALGLEDKIGSLETGKSADITAIDMSCLHAQPIYDPVSQLIYNQSAQQVSHLWVQGECLLNEGQLQTLDENELKEKANYWRNKIMN